MDPIFTYVTGVVLSLLGVRLLVQAFRLGKAAEGMLGAFLVFAGGGMAVAMWGVNTFRGGEQSAYAYTQVGMFFAALGMSAYAEFIRRSFRAGVTWALGLSAALAIATFTGWYLVVFAQHFGVVTDPHPAAFVPRLLIYLWGIVETVAAYRSHKRRMALGLADPVVVNRFLLFVIWNLLLLAPPVTNAVLRTVDPGMIAAVYEILPASIGMGLAVCTVLIFFPPNAYLDRLREGYTDELEGAS